MSDPLFRQDPYLCEAQGTVISVTSSGEVVLDRSVFYPNSGGQPGDVGLLSWAGGEMSVANTIKGEGADIVLVPAQQAVLPAIGSKVSQRIDWALRYRYMRMHTALHLLSVVIPLPVTGGQISADKGRLDFDMPEAPSDKTEIASALNALIEQDLVITETWISNAELDANPGLIKTLSVQPPRGAGQIRLVRIGTIELQVDLQPCGGTHVRRTSEIGPMRLGKIEKKSRLNRRVYIHFANE
jgi:misacylated tRNA(Ala) deacylase